MTRTQFSHRAVSFVAALFVSFAILESIADHARVNAGPMIAVQAAPAWVAQVAPAVPVVLAAPAAPAVH